MTRIWQSKKQQLEKTVRDFAQRSPVMECLSCADSGPEWRTIVAFTTKTLVKRPGGQVERDGPVIAGIRYHERFLSEAPHPFEIVTILHPPFIAHPNCKSNGAMCLGHPGAAISLDQILHQIWAGLVLNMVAVNTEIFEIANPEAAAYVRANVDQFPITAKGLFEKPDEGWTASSWFAPPDPTLEETYRVEPAGPAAADETPFNDQGDPHDDQHFES